MVMCEMCAHSHSISIGGLLLQAFMGIYVTSHGRNIGECWLILLVLIDSIERRVVLYLLNPG